MESKIVEILALIEAHKNEIKDLKKQMAKLLIAWCESKGSQQMKLFHEAEEG